MNLEQQHTVPDATDIGFSGSEATGWTRSIRGRDVLFRLLRSLDDLAQAERLQEDVFGVSERDLIPANELIVVAETGGAVIGAFLADDAERAAGVLVGWGGFVGRPRIVSDFLAVRPEARNLGLAAELKRLQAVIALGRGFQEIVWTVDPLRSANARLNFGKLGATASAYEIDRYGSGFAPGLYGGMPSDRLHVTWEITSPDVIARLRGIETSQSPLGIPFDPFVQSSGQQSAFVTLPADIDALLAADPAEALSRRLHLRETLLQAFGEGFAITGFLPVGVAAEPAYILERQRGEQR